MLVRSLSQPAAAPKAPATVQEPALQHRPPVDWWEVGARRFDSTADLIASDAVTEAGSPARYHFQTEVPDGSQSGPGNVAGGALAGAAIGAGVAAGGMVALEVLGELANILLSGPYYSASGGFSGGAYLSVAAAAAAAGAVGGALLVRAGGESLAERGYAVDGTVRRENGSQNVFYPGSRVTDGVDLDGYAQAPDLPEPVVSQRPWWKDSLQGAGVGAVTPLSACIPLIGLFAPAV
ncbi:MAG: hypothetical protein HY319_09570, partial [Armatimonadetes bacterium]|nr:hypothetical protein [Armatimonadota bacterium]